MSVIELLVTSFLTHNSAQPCDLQIWQSRDITDLQNQITEMAYYITDLPSQFYILETSNARGFPTGGSKL